MFGNRNFVNSPLAAFGGNLNRLLGEAVDTFGPAFTAMPIPLINVWEEGDDTFAEAELPGLKLGDIEVYVVGRELTIKGRRVVEKPENATAHRIERESGEFSRTVSLPAEVDSARVEATLKDGILTVRLPRSENAKARKVEVKNG